VDEIRKLAQAKDFSVRVLDVEGEQVTVIGPDLALDALVLRLAGQVIEINRDQRPLDGYEEARLPTAS
jgi:hypothetical protein